MDHQEPAERPATQDPLPPWDKILVPSSPPSAHAPDHPADLAHRDHPDQVDLRETLATQELLATQDSLDHKDPKDLPEDLEPQDLEDLPAPLATLPLPDLLQLDDPALPEAQVLPDPKDLPVTTATTDSPADPESKDRKDHRELLELQATLVAQAPLASPEHQAHATTAHHPVWLPDIRPPESYDLGPRIVLLVLIFGLQKSKSPV
jgi:hypothetical protein